ncbi:MAG: TonB-dependent receptor [Proteobacteria bacterium]|nr:TonB-dependent receptor [Pseudomonadota bacterium]
MAKHLQSGDKRAADHFSSILYPSRGTALSLAIAIALGMPGMAQAQAAPAAEGELEEIVVTGIRAGIESAIAVKQESMSIVEAISAEDIGKLPDTSIAESISRLPGLTSQRAEGRASAISLRGTDPGFTTALLNGREQVSTGDNRNVEFDQYPSELISQVVVFKTPDSQLVGQGLAGTIDLRTVRPLDYGKQTIALNIRGEMNSNDDLGADSDDTGYRASFSYIDQFMDGKLGLAFGYAHLDSPLATRGFGTYEPWNAAGSSGGAASCGGGSPDDCINNPGIAAGNYVTNGMKVRADMGSTERDGLMASLQFAPNDMYTGVIDLYYSTMDQTNNARSLEVNLGGYPAPCCDGTFPAGTVFGYSNTTVAADTIVAGTLNNVMPLVRNFLFTTEDEIFATGWRNEFQLSDEWSMVADISYSKATRDQLQPEINAQYVTLPANGTAPRNQYDTGTFQLRNNSNMPSLSFLRDYTDPTQVQIGPTIYGAGYTKKPHTEDELTSFRLDATRTADWWWFDSFSFGANYSDRSKEKQSPESGLGTIGGGYLQIDQQFLLRNTNLNYADAGQALALNVNGVLREYFNPVVWGTPTTPGFAYLAGKFWTVEEEVITTYVRGDLNHEISDTVTMRGNAGVQVIYTDQSSDSFRVDTGAGNAVFGVTDGKDYTDILPQINLAFLLPDSQAVRVGISQQLARARMDQLKATEESGFNFATGEPGGSGGNAQLDPWKAWALDVSYEKYFYENKGYVSAAAFYKDLDTYIYNQTTDGHDFTALCATTPDAAFPPGVTKQCTGRFTQPVNGEGGYLWGMEFAASLPFDVFSDALDGFGAIVSYSYTDSDIEIQGSISSVATQNITLPGLSQDVWNATLYYEKYGFGARIATRYRSEYIGEVANFANERALRYVDADMITDAQLSYAFSGNMFEGLQVLFQVNNLTNEPYIAYSENKQRLLDYQEYGTQYLLGLNYRF